MNAPIPCLTIWQPWAWAILHAGKRIENRSRKDGSIPPLCNRRGLLAIHAGKGGGVRDFHEAVGTILRRARVPAFDQEMFIQPEGVFRPHPSLPIGGIVGVCRVIGTVHPSGALDIRPKDDTEVLDMRWHIPGSYGLVLADVRPVKFFACKGAQGLWASPREWEPEFLTEAT